ncbi:MAG: YkgJ family cysteine cluster protein [Cyanobacteriota bacterium]
MGRSEHWTCISGCGACCRLDPDRRPEALEALNPEQRAVYLSMVGPDGWCRHYDSGGRRCRIYEDRPDFCQVANLVALFAHDPEVEPDALAIRCCIEQIRSEYGGRGRVMKRFRQAIRRRINEDAPWI